MATSNAALIAAIRFQLNQLSSANGHHAFEHLARHLARARVYSNILPATGPVGAGGDGGRDFQTFKVGLNPSFTKNSRFAQTASGDRQVAFACTLEAKIEPKIRSDVQAILADGPADEVVYFCESNLPIGRRRKLRKWAGELGVELNIFDGVAIAEMLADPEVFWIAQEFLSISADLMPPRTQEADWYSALRARWLDRVALPVSQSDFFEVKAGLRHATFETYDRPDLRFWIDRIAPFFGEHAPRPLTRSAIYELAVANLRGRNEMTSQLGRIEDYYSDCAEHLGLADLQDAANLLVYAFTGVLAGHLEADADTLFGWRRQLDEVIQTQLEAAQGPGRRSGLLRVRGHLGLLPPNSESPPDSSVAYADWHLMLDEAKDAPLFPVEAFSDFLIGTLAWGIDQKQLLELAARADEMIAARGGAPAAEKAIARARTLLENDQFIAAVDALHAAKKHFFSGDHVVDLLRSFLLLAHCYQNLGLAYAAKYYALAAAYVADHEQEEPVARLLPEALHVAIDAEDAAGNSFCFFTLLLQAVAAHFRLGQDPFDQELHPWLNANLSHLAALLGLLRRGQPALEDALAEPLALWPEPLRLGFMSIVDSPEADWNQGSWDDLWALFETVTIDRPFGDLGPRREVRWEALGLSWTTNFDNSYVATPLAEQFIAALQVALASHAGRDLGLAPSSTTIAIVLDADATETSVALNREAPAGPTFTVTLPMHDRDQDQIKDTLAAVATILRMHTVLDNQAFIESLRPEAMGEMFVARPYAEVWRHFVEEEMFFETVRRGATPFRADLPWPAKPHSDLIGFQGPGPTYDEAEALGSIEKRYRVILPVLKHTLPHLLSDSAVYARLVAMHEEGMRDWEILGVLSNVAMNAKLQFDDERPIEELIALGEAFFELEEQPEEALGPESFSEEALTACRAMFVGAHLDAWRLPVPPAATIAGLERLLTERYGMRDLDIEHDDIFGWPALTS